MIALSVLSTALAVGTWTIIRRLEANPDERDLTEHILYVPEQGWRQ